MNPLAPATRPHRRMRTRKTARELSAARAVVPVLIAYADVPAARNAMLQLNRQLRATGRDCQLQPMLWRFDQFAHRPWRELALRDARRAHVVVLAMSDAGMLNAPAEAWLVDLAASQGGAEVSVITLLGTDEAWTISLQQTHANTRPSAVAMPARPPAPAVLSESRRRVAA